MKTSNNPILQNMALNGSLIYNFSALIFTLITVFLFLSENHYLLFGFKIEDQMMALLSLGFIIAMVQIIWPTYKNKDKGEPNEFYFDVNILCYAWLLFGVFYDKDLVILLNVVNISISTFVLSLKRGWSGVKVLCLFS